MRRRWLSGRVARDLLARCARRRHLLPGPRHLHAMDKFIRPKPGLVLSSSHVVRALGPLRRALPLRRLRLEDVRPLRVGPLPALLQRASREARGREPSCSTTSRRPAPRTCATAERWRASARCEKLRAPLSSALRIYLVRHGETELNAARILQPPATPLSERGVRRPSAWRGGSRGSGSCGCWSPTCAAPR